MPKVTQVALVEQDPFAKNWMSLLFSRDLRTRVVAELKSPAQLSRITDQASLRVDLIILDLDMAGKDYQAPGVADVVARLKGSTGVICVGSQVNSHVPQWLAHPQVKGYILKDEIDNSLAWAAVLAVEGNRVVTPGVLREATSAGLPLQKRLKS
jgi:DNA-binding NarL/FixJ family response regulator